ncbi:uncharacterized protein TNCV_1254731 [Trichonephila clavipes]|nr:uncharacterized protein TNCV_1254731 [Trichonephila clavipes]
MPLLAELSRTTEFGGYISGNVILNSLDSPYEIRKDVIIESGSSLVIKPGVELRFAPGIGITVMKEAVLEARAFSFGRPDCKNSPQSHIVIVYDAGMTKVVFSILLSGMMAIGGTMESGRRGYGASSGWKVFEFFGLAVSLKVAL